MRIGIDLQGLQSEGSSTRGIGRYSFEIIRNLIKLSPKHYFIEGKILHTNMQICNWENYENDIKNLIQSLEKHEKIIDPFSIISLTEKADHQKRASEIFSNYKFPKQLENKINSDKNNLKTRLGYFSPDFCDHPVLHLIFDVFKNHNKRL